MSIKRQAHLARLEEMSAQAMHRVMTAQEGSDEWLEAKADWDALDVAMAALRLLMPKPTAPETSP